MLRTATYVVAELQAEQEWQTKSSSLLSLSSAFAAVIGFWF
jgi:hypothetical protein